MSQPIQQLVLFDIDGTLLITRGMTSRCIEATGKRLFDESFVMGKIAPGRLDHQLFDDIATSNGITLTAELLERWKAIYFEALAAELADKPGDVVVLPGVGELWRRLHDEPGVAVGLLTGNFKTASHLKLDAAGLDRAGLAVEAHGEDAEDRVGLVRLAVRRMAERGAELPGDRVTVVGDTPRDIECARGAGCRCLAVATGRYSKEQLAEHGPDALVGELAESGAVAAALGLGQGLGPQDRVG